MTGNKTYYLKYLLTLSQIIVMLADTQSIQGFISSIITPVNMCLSEMSDGLMLSKRKMSLAQCQKVTSPQLHPGENMKVNLTQM